MAATTQAIVFVLTEHLMPNAHICYQYCLTAGYHAVGIVKDDFGQAQRYVLEGKASVIVVATDADLAPSRATRVEVVAQHRKPGNERQVRTERLNRPDVGA